MQTKFYLGGKLMRLKGFLFFFIIVLALSGCSNGEGAGAISGEEGLSSTFEENDQNFEVIHAYQLFNPYYEESKSLPKEEVLALYKSSIIDQVNDKCFKDGENIQMAQTILNEEPKNRIAVQDVIKKIDFAKTNEAVKEALIQSSKLLPTEKDTTVCIFPTNDSTTLSFAAGSGKIILLYNRNYSADIIKSAVAHEYFNSVALEKQFADSSTVLDQLVLKGKAVMFEKMVFPNFSLTSIDETFKKEQWAKIEGDLGNSDPDRGNAIIKGGPQVQQLPKNYGASEGYKMVKAYLDANPDTPVEEWAAKPAGEIFEETDYQANYN